ncbi:hypothetical protein IX38_07355 [Chryseobacterium luteum]|uniref:Uncharacterized protein n=1 Tax=Chryseobacterium luteum TaxID=421531 RepID=A0A085ZU59_9FLAO|nr:hypothetical protein IX38_07355 [Chryseobacterium luteum]
MKKNFGEKYKLPLSFKQMEYFKHKNSNKIDSNTICVLKSEKYQSDFYVREKPVKSLFRLL